MTLFQKPTAVAEHDYRVYVLIATVAYIGTPVHVLLIPFFLVVGAPWLAGLNVASAAAWTYSLVANRRGRHQVAITLVIVEVFVHSVACATTLGLSLGFQHYLWGGATFIMLNSRLGRGSFVAITAGLGVTFVALTVFLSDTAYVYRHPGVIPFVHTTNVLIAFLATGLVTYHFRTISQGAERAFEVLASTDPLTGLPNRRRMLEEVEKRIALARRERLALSLVLVDVDHFKVVNDSLGHDSGDAVLKEVAHRMAQRLRKSDLVARWGGEEFLVLLHGPHENAEAFANTLRASVADATVRLRDDDVAVTVTLGGAFYRSGETIDGCVRRADQALYRGKQAGRNRVVFDAALA